MMATTAPSLFPDPPPRKRPQLEGYAHDDLVWFYEASQPGVRHPARVLAVGLKSHTLTLRVEPARIVQLNPITHPALIKPRSQN